MVYLPIHVDLLAAVGLPVGFGTAHLAIKEELKSSQVCWPALLKPLTSSNGAFELPAAMPINDRCVAVCCAAFFSREPSFARLFFMLACLHDEFVIS